MSTDHIHSSNPSIHADLIEVQGLHKEYDRWVGYRERVCVCLTVLQVQAHCSTTYQANKDNQHKLAASCRHGLL